MFGITRCPFCGELQGCEMGHKTSACRGCGKRMDMSKQRIRGPYKDSSEMRLALWDMKSGGMDESEMNLKEEIMVEQTSGPGVKMNRKGREDLVLSMIGEGLETTEKITEACRIYDLGEDDVRELIESLQRKNLIYSPGYGRFKKV